jgi:hypothetical protein
MTDPTKPKPRFPLPDPLERPVDWIDPKESQRARDYSKIRRYQASEGFEYWLDPLNNMIRTSLPDVFLSFHAFHAPGYAGYSYAMLHYEPGTVVLTKYSEDSDTVATFSPILSERTADGAQIWHIDQIFRVLALPDHERFPWVEYDFQLPKTEVRGLSSFASRSEQCRFIYLCETLLSCHDGIADTARDGSITKGKVIWGKELQVKFECGEFINAA